MTECHPATAPTSKAGAGVPTRLGDREAVLLRLPELSALARLVENSDWHDGDVRQQSLRLFEFVVGLPVSLYETVGLEEAPLHEMLLQVVDDEQGSYTVQDLLGLTALIHDVGKAKTFESQPDGTTRCPGHEAVSASMVPAICARFDLTSQETGFTVRLVAGHGEPYEMYKRLASLPKTERDDALHRFEDEWGDDLLPLLLLACGDLVTSHLASRCPEKYGAILTFYRAWLDRLAR